VFEAIPEEKMIREFVRQVAKQYGRDYWLAKAREGAFPEELWKELGAGGYLGMMIPEEHGGGGLGLQQMAVLIEEMGQHGIPLLLMVVGNVMDAGLIAKYGSAEMKERYLPPLARGDTRFCFALTEPTAGSNSFRIETSAKLDGDEYVLNGQKMFITGVDASDHLLVVARTTSFEEATSRCSRWRWAYSIPRRSSRSTSMTSACRGLTSSAKKGRALGTCSTPSTRSASRRRRLPWVWDATCSTRP